LKIIAMCDTVRVALEISEEPDSNCSNPHSDKKHKAHNVGAAPLHVSGARIFAGMNTSLKTFLHDEEMEGEKKKNTVTLKSLSRLFLIALNRAEVSVSPPAGTAAAARGSGSKLTSHRRR
jgi:hypothetical protein